MPVNGALSTTANRLWDVATKLSVIAMVGIVAMVINHEVRVSVIEASRFTSAEGEELRRDVMEALPPEWLRQDVAELKASMRNVEKAVVRLETKVEEIRGD